MVVAATIHGCDAGETGRTDADVADASEATDAAASSYDPGVAPDLPSNGLDDGDRARICAELGELIAGLGHTESVCLVGGYAAAEATGSTDEAMLRMACQESFDRCVTDSAGRPAGGNLCRTPNDCSGTVEEGIACVIDAAEGQIQFTSELPPCGAITVDALNRFSTLQLPPSPPCAQFNDTCG